MTNIYVQMKKKNNPIDAISRSLTSMKSSSIYLFPYFKNCLCLKLIVFIYLFHPVFGKDIHHTLTINPVRQVQQIKKNKGRIFRAFIKQGSLVEKISDQSVATIKQNKNILAEEEYAGSSYSFILNKNKKKIYRCLSKDLDSIESIIKTKSKRNDHDIKVTNELKKDNIELSIENLFITRINNHTILNNSEEVSSLGLSSGIKIKNTLPLNPTAILSFYRTKGDSFTWNNLSLEFKISYDFKFKNNFSIHPYIKTGANFLGSFKIRGEKLSLKSNHYAMGILMKWKKNLFTIEFINDFISFSKKVSIQKYNLINTKIYHKGILLKIGREFEVNL